MIFEITHIRIIYCRKMIFHFVVDGPKIYATEEKALREAARNCFGSALRSGLARPYVTASEPSLAYKGIVQLPLTETSFGRKAVRARTAFTLTPLPEAATFGHLTWRASNDLPMATCAYWQNPAAPAAAAMNMRRLVLSGV